MWSRKTLSFMFEGYGFSRGVAGARRKAGFLRVSAAPRENRSRRDSRHPVRDDQPDVVVADAAFEFFVDWFEAFGAEAFDGGGDGVVLLARDPGVDRRRALGDDEVGQIARDRAAGAGGEGHDLLNRRAAAEGVVRLRPARSRRRFAPRGRRRRGAVERDA